MQKNLFLIATALPFMVLALLIGLLGNIHTLNTLELWKSVPGTLSTAGLPNSNQLDDQPILIIPDDLEVASGRPVTVPVTFQTNGATVTGMVFSIDFDERCLHFDGADIDGDLIPDAININVTPQHSPSVTYDPTDEDGELDFVIADFRPPLAPLPEESTIAMIVLLATCQPAPGSSLTAAVNFSTVPNASFGDADGRDVLGSVDGGSIRIMSDVATPEPTLVPGITPTAAPTSTTTITQPTGTNNQLPIAINDLVAMNEDDTIVIDALANDNDPDGDSLSLIGIGQGLHGTTIFTTENRIAYQPNPNYNGTDSFFYLVSDGSDAQVEGTITVTIAAVNDPPVIESPGAQVHQEGDEIVLDLAASDPDHESEDLIFSASGLPPELRVDQTQRQIRGTAGIGAAGSYSVTLTVSDTLLIDSTIFTWKIDCLLCPIGHTPTMTYVPFIVPAQ